MTERPQRPGPDWTAVTQAVAAIVMAAAAVLAVLIALFEIGRG